MKKKKKKKYLIPNIRETSKFDSFWRTGNIKFKLYQGYINVKCVFSAYLSIEILWKKDS